MAVGTEVEAKIRVETMGRVLTALKTHKGVRLRTENHEDAYFDNGSLFDYGHFLRLRRQTQTVIPTKSAYIIYKGSGETSGGIKSSQERSSLIADPDAIEAILGILGCNKVFTVKKRRTIFALGNCKVALDDVDGIGQFVEVEGHDEQSIQNAIRLLGLGGVKAEEASYAELAMAKT